MEFTYEELLEMPTIGHSYGDELKVDEPGVRRIWVSDTSRVSNEIQTENWCNATGKWQHPVTMRCE